MPVSARQIVEEIKLSNLRRVGEDGERKEEVPQTRRGKETYEGWKIVDEVTQHKER